MTSITRIELKNTIYSKGINRNIKRQLQVKKNPYLLRNPRSEFSDTTLYWIKIYGGMNKSNTIADDHYHNTSTTKRCL